MRTRLRSHRTGATGAAAAAIEHITTTGGRQRRRPPRVTSASTKISGRSAVSSRFPTRTSRRPAAPPAPTQCACTSLGSVSTALVHHAHCPVFETHDGVRGPQMAHSGAGGHRRIAGIGAGHRDGVRRSSFPRWRAFVCHVAHPTRVSHPTGPGKHADAGGNESAARSNNRWPSKACRIRIASGLADVLRLRR